MKGGIYFVKFKSNIQDFGEGTVVVKNGVVNGGDYGFTYQGRVDDNCLKLSTKQHDNKVISVFGNITDYEVVLDINSVGNDYELVGKTDLAPEVIIQVQAKFIGELLT